MTADYGDRVNEYKLSYAGNGQSGDINVSEPAIISGLTRDYDKGEVTLKYDGTVLDTGAIIGDTCQSSQDLSLLIEAWKSGLCVRLLGRDPWRNEMHGGRNRN
jgi:hypothetical protein